MRNDTVLDVLDVLGVIRAVGYSIAGVAALIAAGLYLLSFMLPLLGVSMALLAPYALLGLCIAWVSALSRVLVRRMRFSGPQA